MRLDAEELNGDRALARAPVEALHSPPARILDDIAADEFGADQAAAAQLTAQAAQGEIGVPGHRRQGQWRVDDDVANAQGLEGDAGLSEHDKGI